MAFSSILWVLLPLTALLSACTVIPPVLEQKPVEDLPLSQVQINPLAYQNKRVRWGGRILKIENDQDVTWVQVLAVPLKKSQRPREDTDGIGRFLVRSSDFLDPAIFEPKREITVVGRLDGQKIETIGKHKVRLVVVRAEAIYLWPKRAESRKNYCYPYTYPCWPYWNFYPYWYGGPY